MIQVISNNLYMEMIAKEVPFICVDGYYVSGNRSYNVTICYDITDPEF